jgi:hypothetical protein
MVGILSRFVSASTITTDTSERRTITIERYFRSDPYAQLASPRSDKKEFATKRHSWNAVAQMTIEAYAEVLGLPIGAGTSLVEQS